MSQIYDRNITKVSRKKIISTTQVQCVVGILYLQHQLKMLTEVSHIVIK
jgi:hypothetical protein